MAAHTIVTNASMNSLVQVQLNHATERDSGGASSAVQSPYTVIDFRGFTIPILDKKYSRISSERAIQVRESLFPTKSSDEKFLMLPKYLCLE
jgi:hypothetical protein